MGKRPVSTEEMIPIAVDSRANENIVNDYRLFTKTKEITPLQLHSAGGSVMKAEHKGQMKICIYQKKLVLMTVYNIPTL